MSRSDVDPAAPLDEARGGGRCGCVSVSARLAAALVCSRSLFVSTVIDDGYRGGPRRREPRPATRKTKPATLIKSLKMSKK